MAVTRKLIRDRQELQKAQIGLSDVVSTELPSIEGFEVVTELTSDWSNSAAGKTCYYAEHLLVIGFSLPEEDALDVYSQALPRMGWLPRHEQYDYSRVFAFGDNTSLNAWFGEPGIDLKDAVDYAQLREVYEGTMYVRIVFALPQREGC